MSKLFKKLRFNLFMKGKKGNYYKYAFGEIILLVLGILIGLLRYSSDFRPITQRNHSVSISNMNNDDVREKIQNYFIEEDKVLDIFLEYVDIVHNKVRPYLSETGMHNLESIYEDKSSANLKKDVLIAQLSNVKFQQILYERRLKTDSFERFLNILKNRNQLLINYLSSLN